MVDFRIVNLTIDRTGWPFKPTSKVLQKIKPDTNMFWSLDFLHGYFQVSLQKDNIHLAAIILPLPYTFNFLPMGLNAAVDGFNSSSDVIIMDPTRVEIQLTMYWECPGHTMSFIKNCLTYSLNSYNIVYSILESLSNTWI